MQNTKAKFLFHALKDFTTVGSFMPSQKYLVKNLTAPINSARAKYIVELGAGEGCVTRGIIKKMSPKSKLLSFEINPDLIRLYKPSNKNVIMINDDVKNFEEYMKKYKIKEIDYVVSSLPLAQIRKKEVIELLEKVSRNLNKNGKFIQYQYSLKSLKHLKNNFSHVDVKFTPLNFPPAFVYVCKK